MRLVVVLLLGLAMLMTPIGAMASTAAPQHEATNLYGGHAATGHVDCGKAAGQTQHDCHVTSHSHHPLGKAAFVSLVLAASANCWPNRASLATRADLFGAIDHPPRASIPA